MVVFCDFVFVKHSNFCWLLFVNFFLSLFAVAIIIDILPIYLLSIVNTLVLFIPFVFVNITFNSFISLECIIHFSIFNINFQINLISFYFKRLFQSSQFISYLLLLQLLSKLWYFFNCIYVLVLVVYNKSLSVLNVNYYYCVV